MEHFFQAIGAVLIAVILILILRTSDRGIGELLSILVCGMVIVVALRYIQPLTDFLNSLQSIIKADSEMIKILLKSVGISITAEIVELICKDAGNSAMGKTVQILATAVIACLSIPMLTALMELIKGVLSNV